MTCHTYSAAYLTKTLICKYKERGHKNSLACSSMTWNTVLQKQSSLDWPNKCLQADQFCWNYD